MQVPVFAPSAQVEEAMGLLTRRLDPMGFEAVPYSSWESFGRACEHTLAAVVFFGRDRGDLLDRLARLRETSATGLLWVKQESQQSNMDLPGPAGIAAVRADDAAGDRVVFLAAYRRARTAGFLRRQARRLSEVHHLGQELRRYVVAALLADPPYPSNRAYASECGCTLARLESRFRAVPDLTPKILCQAVLAVHVGMRRPVGCSWEWLASELGTDSQRFRRTTRRLVGCPPAECEAGYGTTVMTWFEDYFTRVLDAPTERRPGAPPPDSDRE